MNLQQNLSMKRVFGTASRADGENSQARVRNLPPQEDVARKGEPRNPLERRVQ